MQEIELLLEWATSILLSTVYTA